MHGDLGGCRHDGDAVGNAPPSPRCECSVARGSTRKRLRHACGRRPFPAPIPDRLGYMRPKNVGTTGKIRNRPRHPQNAMHRTRRQLQQIDRVLQHRLIFGGEPADRIGARLIEMRVAATGALQLNLARTDDAGVDDIAGFARRRVWTQFGRRQSRHFYMQSEPQAESDPPLTCI